MFLFFLSHLFQMYEVPGQSNKKVSILVGGTLGKPTTKIM